MTVTRDRHTAHGATFHTRGGREIPNHYGRPATAHRAVRNGVGVIEMPYDILELRGPDHIEFVDAAITNTVTPTDDAGTYALVLDPDGRVTADLYAYRSGDRLLAFLPPGTGDRIGSAWRDRIIRRDVEIESVTTEYGVFGVHGPTATEKVASVLNDAPAPDDCLAVVRGRIDGDGVTVVRSDDRVGEEGYEIICATPDADRVLDSLLTKGYNAAPFGDATWESLTLEAGTPLYRSELADRIPVGLVGGGYDRSKGCFPGQEVIARIEDRGRPPHRLVGLVPESVPTTDDTVTADGRDVGVVTRTGDPPTCEHPVALAIIDYGFDGESVTIGDDISATVQPLPFTDTGMQSKRLPPTD